MFRVFRSVLLVTLVLSVSVGCSAVAGPVDDPIQSAVAWLHTQQLEDGSFGGASATADVVYVLGLLGEDPSGPAWTVSGTSALKALETLTPDYVLPRGAGEAGKVLRAVALAGANPRSFAGIDLVATVEAYYDPATGRYHPDYLFRHTLAVEGLMRAGRPVPQAALATLLAARLPDGGWFWSFSGSESEVDTTGRVLYLLAGQARHGCADLYESTATYLAAAQRSDAGWGVSPPPDSNASNANSTALAVAGLKAASIDPDSPPFRQDGTGGQGALLSFQEPSGAFMYLKPPGSPEVRLVATLDALVALAQPVVAQLSECQ